MSERNPPVKRAPYDVVVIGASAGGVDAVCELLEHLPKDLPATVLVSTHRALHIPSHLLEVLQRHAKMPVEIAREGEVLRHGVCYIGEPQRHLTMTHGCRARLVADGFYRAHNIDALFTSAARHCKSRVIGVVLSGMLKDGTEGLLAVKDADGVALVQLPQEAAYSDMPKNAMLSDGKIDLVGPVQVLAEKICELTGSTDQTYQPVK